MVLIRRRVVGTVPGTEAFRPDGVAELTTERMDRRLPPLVWIATVLSAVAAVAFGVSEPFGHPAVWALIACPVAVTISELAVVHFHVGRQRWTISSTDAVIALILTLAPGSWLAVVAPAGMAVAQLLRRQSAPKIVFNVCQIGACAAVASTATHLALQYGVARLTAAGVGMVFVWAAGSVIVAVPIAATSETGYLRVLAGNAPRALVHTAASASVGLLAGWLAVTAPVGLFGLVVPLVLLWSSFDQTSRRAAEARLFAELARGQEQAGGGSVDVSAQVVVTTAARLLGGAHVSLLLFASDGLIRYDGTDRGTPVRRRVPVSTMQETWIPEVLSGGVVLGIDDGSPTCGMRVGPAERPLALIHAVREPGTGAFTRHDAALARVLVGQAETWLSVADLAASRDAALDRVEVADEAARALGDLGAHTAPALAALRESAGRLARLAGGGSSGESVEDIVEELRSVEQAVASLLGAIALAADPELSRELDELHGLTGPATPPAPRTSDDWTSTGVLP